MLGYQFIVFGFFATEFTILTSLVCWENPLLSFLYSYTLIYYDIQWKTVAKLQNLEKSSQNPKKQKPNEDSFPTRPEAFGSLSDFATVEGHGRGNRVADKMQIIERWKVYLSF